MLGKNNNFSNVNIENMFRNTGEHLRFFLVC